VAAQNAVDPGLRVRIALTFALGLASGELVSGRCALAYDVSHRSAQTAPVESRGKQAGC